MVKFIKTCNQYPCKFNFGHIFSSIVSPALLRKIDFKNTLFGENGWFPSSWSGDDKNLGESFAWGYE